MKKIILYLIVIAAIASSCKKYEEGPLISFRSAKNRVYGDYKLEKYTVNGADSLELIYDSLVNSFYFHHSESENFDLCDIFGVRRDGKMVVMKFEWELIEKNSYLQIKVDGAIGTGPFGNRKTSEWKILRLTHIELKMKTDYNGKEYLVDLVQK